MRSMQPLTSPEQVDEILAAKQTCFVLKHSTACPISAAAFQETANFTADSDVPVYLLKVIEDRPASNHLAEVTGIRHESPQAIYFVEGKPVWNASHYKITQNVLHDQVQPK